MLTLAASLLVLCLLVLLLPDAPPRRRVLATSASAFTAVSAWSASVWADGGQTGASGDPLGDLQRTLTAALTAAAVAAVSAVGAKAWGWLTQHTAVKRLEKEAGLKDADVWVAEHAIAYAEEQAKKAIDAGSKELEGGDKMRAARQFIEAHGYAGDAVDRLARLVESRLSIQRQADAQLNRVANAAKNLNDALAPSGDIGKDLARLREMEERAKAAGQVVPASKG